MDLFKNIDVSILNNHYWNRYIKFINNIQSKGKRKLKYKEKHHIIPRCLDNSLCKEPENLIILSPREHFIAHLILSKCFIKDSEAYYKMNYALLAMVNLKMKYHSREYYLNSSYYESLRITYIKYRREYMKTHIREDKYKSLIGKGKPSPNKGMIWITNGTVNKYINKDDSIPLGWYKGCTQSKKSDHCKQALKEAWNVNRENRIGKNHPMYGKGDLLKGNKNGRYGIKLKYINNGIKNKMVKYDELETYLENGWVLGKLR